MKQQQLAKFLDEIRALLEDKQAELTAIRDASAEARAPVSLDQQSVGRVSRIDAMQQQAMAKAQERQRAVDLMRIEQALARIEADEYGYCLECDEEIPIKRLRVDPAAVLCIACAGRN